MYHSQSWIQHAHQLNWVPNKLQYMYLLETSAKCYPSTQTCHWIAAIASLPAPAVSVAAVPTWLLAVANVPARCCCFFLPPSPLSRALPNQVWSSLSNLSCVVSFVEKFCLAAAKHKIRWILHSKVATKQDWVYKCVWVHCSAYLFLKHVSNIGCRNNTFWQNYLQKSNWNSISFLKDFFPFVEMPVRLYCLARSEENSNFMLRRIKSCRSHPPLSTITWVCICIQNKYI